MSVYFLVNSKPMVFFYTLPAGQWWGLLFPLPPMLIEVMIVKVKLVVLMLIKGNLLQKHQCCSGSVQLCISSLLNRSTSTSVGNNCLVGKDGEEELKLKRERKKNKIMKWFCCKWDGTCEWDVSGDWQEFWLWRNLGEQFWRGKCCGVFPQKSQYHLPCGLIKKYATQVK